MCRFIFLNNQFLTSCRLFFMFIDTGKWCKSKVQLDWQSWCPVLNLVKNVKVLLKGNRIQKHSILLMFLFLIKTVPLCNSNVLISHKTPNKHVLKYWNMLMWCGRIWKILLQGITKWSFLHTCAESITISSSFSFIRPCGWTSFGASQKSRSMKYLTCFQLWAAAYMCCYTLMTEHSTVEGSERLSMCLQTRSWTNTQLTQQCS